MSHAPISSELIKEVIQSIKIKNVGTATIREIVMLVNQVEAKSNSFKFIRMEMGVPSLPPPTIGIEAEIDALKAGVASKYPMLDGLPILKEEAARFIKLFMDVDIHPAHITPMVGSMEGTFASFLTLSQCHPKKQEVLFIDPGFPVQKQQLQVLGISWKSFDVYDFRGPALEQKLDELLSSGTISTIIYSNPNNPSWICFKEDELEIIGRKATEYDVVVIEDLAYFGMDFRKDLGAPGHLPYQSTVAQYTDNYILTISSSKAFSYAGQRIGLTAVSDKLFERVYPALRQRYDVETFGGVLVSRVLYAITSGAGHSSQYALAAMLKATNDGAFKFLDEVKEYGERAKIMKAIFLKNGFHLVYDTDMEEPLADGFYFTIAYQDMSGAMLAENLLYYGISSISLSTTGSKQEGVRACTAFVTQDQFQALDNRLKAFHRDF